jgi:hypothetical protein
MRLEQIERWAIVCGLLGLAVAIGLECGGCAATARTERIGLVPTSQPAGQASIASQAGGVNAAVQGVTGVRYTRQDALPVGLALLLALDKWLSHRREMTRLKCRNRDQMDGGCG